MIRVGDAFPRGEKIALPPEIADRKCELCGRTGVMCMNGLAAGKGKCPAFIGWTHWLESRPLSAEDIAEQKRLEEIAAAEEAAAENRRREAAEIAAKKQTRDKWRANKPVIAREYLTGEEFESEAAKAHSNGYYLSECGRCRSYADSRDAAGRWNREGVMVWWAIWVVRKTDNDITKISTGDGGL